MKTLFIRSETNFGCYGEPTGSNVTTHLPSEAFTLTDVLNANISLQDKAWFIRKNCEFTDKELRPFAIGCALCVLPIYEEKYPDNKAPRKATEAVQAYLTGNIGIDELGEARRAAVVAAAAADAYAYAYAAYAAAYAAYASAYAAYASAYAAYAYAASNGKLNYQDTLLQFFKDFTNDIRTN